MGGVDLLFWLFSIHRFDERIGQDSRFSAYQASFSHFLYVRRAIVDRFEQPCCRDSQIVPAPEQTARSVLGNWLLPLPAPCIWALLFDGVPSVFLHPSDFSNSIMAHPSSCSWLSVSYQQHFPVVLVASVLVMDGRGGYGIFLSVKEVAAIHVECQL